MAIDSKSIWSKFIQRKLLLVLLLAALLMGSLLFIDYLGIQILSTTRAYVHGESAYSKGQKNALIHLIRYIDSHNEARYKQYLEQIAIPMADKHARVELEKRNPDLATAQAWYIKGGNHPKDVEQMASFFKYLTYSKPTKDVLQLWRKADALIERLDEHAATIHSLIETKRASREELNGEIAQILEINEQLTVLEDDFSLSLGQIARQTERVLFYATCFVSFCLFVLFTYVVSRTFRRIKGSEEKYRTLFEEAINGIILSAPNGKITDINPMAASLIDLRNVQELSSLRLEDIYAKFKNGSAIYELFLSRERLENVEIEILYENSTKAYALLNVVTHYDSKGQIQFYRTIIRDITDQKLSEQVLKAHYEELKKINTELDSFVYRASHDLRAPLASLLGLIDISRLEQSPQVRAHYFELMSKSVHKLDIFIKNIIAYSKNARIAVSVEPVNFKLLIEETLDNLHYMEGVDKIDKQLLLDTSYPFYSDPFRLQIIFSNFISNAIKYNNGQDTAYLLIKVVTMEQKAVIEFVDNGIGIAGEDHAKIFEMFYRATGQNAGSGLGLYIVKEALTFLKGSIKVQSQVGQGSHFTIELPSMTYPKE